MWIVLLAFTIPPGSYCWVDYLAVPSRILPQPAASTKPEPLPARFPWLPRVALIIIAPASTAPTTTAAKLLPPTTAPAASRTIRLRLRFVDLQRAPTQLGSIQRRDGLIGFRRICHFDKPETSGASRLTVGHDADFFHRTVSLENGS